MKLLGRFTRAFDPRGRMSADAYRRVFIRTILYGAGLLCLAIWLAALGGRAAAILTVGTLPLVGLAYLAATARRLHDRDRSAKWLAIWVLAQAVGYAPLGKLAEPAPLLTIALVLGMLGVSAWFLTETLLRRGTPGPNRFGPPDSVS